MCTRPLQEAENLRQMSRRVYHESDPSERFTIYFGRVVAAWDSLDDKIKTAIRDVVTERYNPKTLALDLSGFQYSKSESQAASNGGLDYSPMHLVFADRDLRNLCSLSRNAVMFEVVLVASKLPGEVRALSLKVNLRAWRRPATTSVAAAEQSPLPTRDGRAVHLCVPARCRA